MSWETCLRRLKNLRFLRISLLLPRWVNTYNTAKTNADLVGWRIWPTGASGLLSALPETHRRAQAATTAAQAQPYPAAPSARQHGILKGYIP